MDALPKWARGLKEKVVCMLEEEIWKAVKDALLPHVEIIGENVERKKGIEEIFYPYLNAKLCKVLNSYEVCRIGAGRISDASRLKYDVVVELRGQDEIKKLILLELKFAKGINSLLFGYQSGGSKDFGQDKGKELANFVMEKQFFGIKEHCKSGVSKKSVVNNGLLVDIAKIVYAMSRESNISCGMAIGVLTDSNCGEEGLKRVLKSVCEGFPEFLVKVGLFKPQLDFRTCNLNDNLKLIDVFVKESSD